MNRLEERVVDKYLEFEKMFPPFIRENNTMLCTPSIAKGWEWCFDPSQAYVLEKLDGTNVKIEVTGNQVLVFGRNQKSKGYVQSFGNDPQYKYINQAVFNYIAKRSKRMKDGAYYGEVLGPNIQGNPYGLDSPMWFTFEPFKDGVQAYKDYPKNNDFEDWKNWILNLNSLLNPNVEAEGVIFLNKQDRRMAKLRKDMFSKQYQHR